MMKDFIPVEARINNKYYTWYMDVSLLSLNDLVNLRNELKRSKTESVVQLDAIIHDTININRQDIKAERRENQRSNRPYRSKKAYVKNRHKGRR